MAANDYSSPALDALKGKFPPGKGPFDDVKLVATEKQKRNNDWVGNADRCDDYDFSDYDLYGMAMHWWHPTLPARGFTATDKKINLAAGKVISWYNNVPARGIYVGPMRDAPKVGDDPVQDPKTGKPMSPDGAQGGVLWKSPKGAAYLVGGPTFPRYNPKDWRAELEREMVFLWLWRELLKKAKAGDYDAETEAMNLMNAFIGSKSYMRSQWVLKIPGFAERGNPADNNGRHTYILFRYRWRQSNPDGKPTPLGFLPSRAPKAMLDTYRDGNVWRFVGGPGFGRPGWLVEPKASEGCEVSAFMMGAGVSLFNFAETAINFASIGLSSMASTAINVATDAIVYAIQGSKGDFKTNALKSYDLFGKTSKGFDAYQVWVDKCVAGEEWGATTKRSGGLPKLWDYWIASCDEVLPKLYNPSKPANPPTVVVPVTTVVTPPKKSAAGLMIAGAAAGAAAGGPPGAVVGAGVGLLLNALRNRK